LALVVLGALVLGAVFGIIAWRARDRTAVLLSVSVVAVLASMGLASQSDVGLVPIAASLILSFGELLLLTAVALLFSSFSTPFLTGLFTIGVWLVGRSADDMATMNSRLLGDELKAALRLLAHVIPNFNLYVPGRHTLETSAEGFGGPWAYVGWSMSYAALAAAVILAVAALIFRRRDFL
jgi:ABC-type transport system involved in multi-copper enzyme maturation permease subunit